LVRLDSLTSHSARRFSTSQEGRGCGRQGRTSARRRNSGALWRSRTIVVQALRLVAVQGALLRGTPSPLAGEGWGGGGLAGEEPLGSHDAAPRCEPAPGLRNAQARRLRLPLRRLGLRGAQPVLSGETGLPLARAAPARVLTPGSGSHRCAQRWGLRGFWRRGRSRLRPASRSIQIS
jgi:hypothetical protein